MTTHEVECPAKGLGLWPSSGLCRCEEIRAALRRGIQEARDAVINLQEDSPFIWLQEAVEALDDLRASHREPEGPA